jgi:integrase/recombinase XerC
MSTLPQLVDQYVTERRDAGELEPSTAANTRSSLLQFVRFVGDVDPAGIRPDHVAQWMAWQPGSKATARNRFSRVKLFFHWLIRQGLLPTDPTLNLRAPRQPRSVPRSLPAETIRVAVEAAPDSRARFVLVWMAQLGLRAVEVVRLEVGDVDFDERTVRVSGKGRHERLLPITQEAWYALTSYLLEHPAPAGPLVRSLSEPWKGISANHLCRLVSGWLGPAGTGHQLRHSSATHVFRQGRADIRDVQSMLGHRSLGATQVYLPFSDVRRLREVMDGRWYGRNSQSTSEAS